MTGVNSSSTPDGPVDSGSGPGDGTVRLYSAHNRIFNGLGMFGGAVVAGVVAVVTHGWLVRVVAALISLGLFAWAVRGALVGVVCTADRLVVRELTRTHTLPWGDVLGVTVRVDPRFKITAPAFMVYADEARAGRRGGRVSAMSLADKRRRVVEEYVRTLTDQWQAHVADSSG
jgi:hypothetical protein